MPRTQLARPSSSESTARTSCSAACCASERLCEVTGGRGSLVLVLVRPALLVIGEGCQMRQKRAGAWVHECGTKRVSQPFPGCRWVHLCGWPELVTLLRGEARRPAQPRPTVRSGLSRGFVRRQVRPPTPTAPRTVRPSVSPTPAKAVPGVLARKAFDARFRVHWCARRACCRARLADPRSPKLYRVPRRRALRGSVGAVQRPSSTPQGGTIGWPRCVAFVPVRPIQCNGIPPNPAVRESSRPMTEKHVLTVRRLRP